MIYFDNVALRRGGKLLFEQARFRINAGEKVGLIGVNGSGKSSLFELILGHISSDQGEVEIASDLVCGHVSQVSPDSEQSVLDYTIDGDTVFREIEQALIQAEYNQDAMQIGQLHERMHQIDGYSAQSRAARILSGLGFSEVQMKQSVNQLSGGWQVRLNLAQALMSPSDYLLLDEPTNHLDLDAIVWLETWLKKYSGTVIVISHDRDFLDQICTSILHLYQQEIKRYKGNYSAFEILRAEALANQQAQFQKQQRQIAHMQDFVRRFKAKASKAKQAQSRVKALEKMEQISAAHVDAEFSFEFFPCDKLSDPIVQIRAGKVGYGESVILDELNIAVSSGECVGLLGRNGAGKSTLIKLLCGELNLMQGEITRADNLSIGYFAQHQLAQLNHDNSVLEEMQSHFPRAKSQDLRNFLGGFGYHGDQVNQKIAPLSGGEKSRLVLAIIVYQRPNLLLLDEPTNHLDLDMRHALLMALQHYEGALLLVSHDRYLVNAVSDRLLLVHQGYCQEFTEDMLAYQKLITDKTQQNNVDYVNHDDQEKANSKKDKRRQSAQLRELLKPLTNQLKKVERKMNDLHQQLQQVNDQLDDPVTYENMDQQAVADLMAAKVAHESALVEQEELWLSLSEEIERLQ